MVLMYYLMMLTYSELVYLFLESVMDFRWFKKNSEEPLRKRKSEKMDNSQFMLTILRRFSGKILFDVN